MLADKTLLEYLTDLRMEEAKCLLKGSNISICDISNQIGFSNLQSFNVSLRKMKASQHVNIEKRYRDLKTEFRIL